MNTTHERRLLKLAQGQKENRVDAMAIVPGANLRYLTGLEMHTSERVTLALFPLGGQPAFVLPELEASRVRANLDLEASFYIYSDQEGPGPAFRQAAGDLRLEGKVLGVEHLRMRVLELRLLEEHAASARFVDGEPFLSQLRIRKDAKELEAMRRASEVNEACFRQVTAHIQPGITE
jgi:Xaa-Pro dipeptidase